MKFHEKIDHMLRQYSYKRSRKRTHPKNKNDFDANEFLNEVDSCVEEVMEEIERIINKRSS